MYKTKDLIFILNEFISKDSLDKAYPILSNTGLADIVSAWSTISVDWISAKYFDDVGEQLPSNEYARWQLLWDFCSFDRTALQLASGLTPQEADYHFQRAKVLRLIYPNGLISPAAKQVLALRVSEEMAKGIEAAEKLSGKGK